MNQNTGGPAFPASKVGIDLFNDEGREIGCRVFQPSQGMSLLDYMAGQALEGSLASQSKESHWAFAPVEYETADDRATRAIAALCYDIAEAMLAEKALRESKSDSGIRTAQSDDGATVEFAVADSSVGKRMANLEAKAAFLEKALREAAATLDKESNPVATKLFAAMARSKGMA